MKTRTIRTLYVVHKWTGLIAGINVLILSLTAAYLLVEGMVHEWTHEHDTGGAAEVVDRANRPAIQPVIDKLITRFEGLDVTMARVDMGVLEDQPDKVAFVGPDGFFRFVIDPTTQAMSLDYGQPPIAIDPGEGADGLVFAAAGTAEQPHDMSPLGEWMLALHSNLFLGTIGTLLTGIVGVLLLVSTLTGLAIYAPFMKALAFGAIRRGPRINFPSADLHKVVGIATLAFNGMMALTGIGLTLGIFAIQFYLLAELKEFEASRGAITLAKKHPPVETIVAEGQKMMPEGYIYRVDYPGGMQGDKTYAIYAYDDPHSRGLIPLVSAVTAEDEPRAIRFAMPLWIKAIVIGIPIHVASFGGNAIRIVYLFLALSSGFLSVTGFVMYVSKRVRKRRGVRATSGEEAFERDGVMGQPAAAKTGDTV